MVEENMLPPLLMPRIAPEADEGSPFSLLDPWVVPDALVISLPNSLALSDILLSAWLIALDAD